MSITGKVEEKSVSLSGCVVLWSLTESTNWETLKRNLEACDAHAASRGVIPPRGGFIKCLPERNTRLAALKKALAKVFSPMGAVIEPLEKKKNSGYQVARRFATEENGLPVNGTEVLFSVPVPKDGQEPELFSVKTGNPVPKEHPTIVSLRAFYHVELGKVPSAKVSKALADACWRMDGTSLRSRGGVYWLPEKYVKTWAWLGACLEKAYEGNRLYRLRTAMDPKGVRTIVERAEREIQQKADELEAQILSGSQGQRALESRREDAISLQERAERYAKIFGGGLESIKTRCDEIDGIATTAIVQLME